MALAQVQRDARLVYRWHAVHELTDPEGSVFVLFVYDIDPSPSNTPTGRRRPR